MYSAANSMINFINFISNCEYDYTNNSLTVHLKRIEQINVAYQSRRKKKMVENGTVKEVRVLSCFSSIQ